MSTLYTLFQILLRYNISDNNDQLKNVIIIGMALFIVWKYRKQILFALTVVLVFVLFFAKEMILALYPDTLNEKEKMAFTIVVGVIMAVLGTKNYIKNSR